MDKHLAESYLIHFIKQAWHILEPSHPLVFNWVLEAICDHLQAVTDGHIRRLIINIPPRFTKSLTGAVFWPAWSWIKKPEVRWLFSSYAESLSIRDSVKCRRVIQSEWYQERWGDVYELTGDQNQKMRFENSETGVRMATSVGGVSTGEGGDILCIDDAHNIKEVESTARRLNVIHWADEVLPSRLNNAMTGAIVVIMQRSHDRDLAGHYLAKNAGYEHLCLPMEYEGNKINTSLGIVDQRKEDGELLCEGRFDRGAVEQLKKDLGSYAYAGQYQQRPVPREGGIVKLHWFGRYTEAPPLDPEDGEPGKLTISVDTAYKPEEIHDPSVFLTFYKWKGFHYLLDVWRKRVGYPELKRSMILYIAKWQPHLNELLIEDKASGISLIQDMRGETDAPIIAIDPGNQSKIVRMDTEAPQVEAGNVLLPENAPWLFDFEDEIGKFPKGDTKDMVDGLSQYLKRNRESSGPPVLRWAKRG